MHMPDSYNISIIGSGNVAWHLAPELENAGHRIVEVYSRNLQNAKKIQNRLYHAELIKSLDFSNSQSEIFILCISDDAIEEVAQEIVLPDDATLIHTSGSQAINILDYAATENIGVFYPLQTFTKGKRITFEDIPILIESKNSYTAKVLKKLGKSISKKVKEVSSKDRIAIHVAAVFACNFTNHLFASAENILRDRGFEFELLRPLIAETINKGLDLGPKNAQTGPAARGDLKILDKHIAFLDGNENQELYRLITEKILNG